MEPFVALLGAFKTSYGSFARRIKFDKFASSSLWITLWINLLKVFTSRKHARTRTC